ncbi:MAG: hypothetical protein ABJI60_19615 [Kangiellaceae bacterium]
MEATKRRIIDLIINECQLEDLPYQNIMLGCQLAEVYFTEGKTFSESVSFGVRIARLS